jgi:hypothetical protein
MSPYKKCNIKSVLFMVRHEFIFFRIKQDLGIAVRGGGYICPLPGFLGKEL